MDFEFFMKRNEYAKKETKTWYQFIEYDTEEKVIVVKGKDREENLCINGDEFLYNLCRFGLYHIKNPDDLRNKGLVENYDFQRKLIVRRKSSSNHIFNEYTDEKNIENDFIWNNLYFIVDYQEPARLDRVYVYDLGNVLFYYQNHGENLERTVSYFYKKLLKDIKGNSDTCVLSITEEMFVHTALKLEIKKLAFWLDHDLEEIL